MIALDDSTTTLMRHSVRVRSREIVRWSREDHSVAVAALKEDAEAFEEELSRLPLPTNLARQASTAYSHLRPWARALERLS